MTREQLLKSSEYHLANMQCDLFTVADDYKVKEKLSTQELSKTINLSLNKTRELLRGDYKDTIENFFKLCLSLNKIPVINFMDVDEYIEKDKLK